MINAQELKIKLTDENMDLFFDVFIHSHQFTAKVKYKDGLEFYLKTHAGDLSPNYNGLEVTYGHGSSHSLRFREGSRMLYSVKDLCKWLRSVTELENHIRSTEIPDPEAVYVE